VRLILASSSSYRKALLARLQIPFEVMAPEIDESARSWEAPPALVQRLAVEKAGKIAAQHRDALVIGSDQVAVYNGAIVGKPHTHERAVAQLREAAGRTVTLYTGLALINAATGATQSEVLPFRVTFRPLTDQQIENYLRKEQPYACAGSVKSEGLGIALLDKFDGEDPTTLIGLPLIRLVRMLENEGVAVV
jgi:septum formation protein